MKTKFRCPKCPQTIQIGPEAMGKRGKCPGCQEVIKIPTAEQFAAAAKAKQAKAAPVPAPAEPDPFEDDLSSLSSSGDAWDDFDLGGMDAAQSGSTTLGPLPKVKAKKSRGGKRGGDIEMVRTGQKLVLFGILLNLSTIPLRLLSGGELVLAAITLIVALLAMVLGIVGIIRLAGGLGYSIVSRVFLCLLTVVPLVGLITLLVLNSKATKQLRANGYQVGLLGA